MRRTSIPIRWSAAPIMSLRRRARRHPLRRPAPGHDDGRAAEEEKARPENRTFVDVHAQAGHCCCCGKAGCAMASRPMPPNAPHLRQFQLRLTTDIRALSYSLRHNNREHIMNIFTGIAGNHMLCWSIVLGLVQLILATTGDKGPGPGYNLSPRDGPAAGQNIDWPLSARLQQFPRDLCLFRRGDCLGDATDRSDVSRWGRSLFLGAAIYVPIYAAASRAAHHDLGGIHCRPGDGAAGAGFGVG